MAKKALPTLNPPAWEDYELIDCGDGRKLERFGDVITIRPEPHALMSAAQPFEQWLKRAHLHFVEEGKAKGHWKVLRKSPDEWSVRYPLGDKSLHFHLRTTRFKHLGVFPEQSINWEYIYQKLQYGDRFLNLFAYTGGASLAARAAGAEVVHVDAIKSVVTWANSNMEASGLDGIRWTVEDALKFAEREVKRGRKYRGIILDPPAFGNGPKGEKWVLAEQLDALMGAVFSLLENDRAFLILNTYADTLPNSVISRLAYKWAEAGRLEGRHTLAELKGASRGGASMPHGLLYRFEVSRS